MLPSSFVGLSGYTVKVVDSTETLHEMCDAIEAAGRTAFDTETRSIDYSKFREGALRKQDMRCDLASFAINSNSKKLAWVVVLGMRTLRCLSEQEYFSTIKTRVMENSEIVKLAWNYSFDGSLYANYGVGVFNVEDLMVKAHLLRGNMGASLKTRCKDVGIELSPFKFKEYWDARLSFDTKATDKKGNLKVSWAQLAALEEPYVNYSAEDAIATMELDPYYDKMLSEDTKRWEYYYRLALPSTICLMRMERRGFPVDTVYLRLIGEQCRQDMQALEVDIFQKVGHHFNLGSTKALAEVLYTELGYPVVKMTDTGARSTDSDALGRLAQQGYELAEKILHWRGKAKLFSAYLDPEAGLTQHITEDGCIHSSFNVCGTESGRLSSSSPNLQQTPGSSSKNYQVRRVFIPHHGYRIIGGDCSQAELRIMADRSSDKNLLDEYLKDVERWKAGNEGLSVKGLPKSDLHTKTAQGSNCTRDQAKGVNFGNLYLMSFRKLASVLTTAAFDSYMDGMKPFFDPISDTVSIDTAKEFQDGFFNTYPGIRAYQQYISDFVKKNGYAVTRYGRIRWLPDAFSPEKWIREAACRAGVNHTIQGFVAELMNLAMCRIENIIPNPDGLALQKLGYRLMAQIHDELQGECPDDDQTAQDVGYHLTRIIQNPGQSTDDYPFSGLKVPMIFEVKQGTSWHASH